MNAKKLSINNQGRQHHHTYARQTSEITTKIPVTPTSTLSRWGSFKTPNSTERELQKPTCRKLGTNTKPPNDPRNLHRAYSFMERGENKRVPGTEPRKNIGAPVTKLNGAPQTPTRIRSLSLSLGKTNTSRLNSPKSPTVTSLPKTPPTTPDNYHQSYRDWDLESVTSNTSGISVASCDHASIARNGTTFSGRSKRYVVHCSEHSGVSGEEYLTPTQRAHHQVKRLKHLLQQTQKDLDSKDTDILRLTKEVVELRLYKAALSSPEEKSTSSNSADIVTIVENHDSIDGDPADNQTSSCADSGHYDDLSNSREDIGSSPYKSKCDKAITADFGPRVNQSEQEKLIVEYERRLQELIHSHEEECHQMKQRHNNKVEELLQRLSEVNARYWELVPDLDAARERIRELEQQLDEACKKLEEQEAIFKQEGPSALQITPVVAQPDIATNPSRISVPDLLHQLEVTRNELENIKAMYRQLVEARNKNKIDPEITLQFLKSAIYYFLTDKENNQGHLRAIQNILGFTPTEISNIDKARMT